MSTAVDIQFGIVPRWVADAGTDRAIALYSKLAATFGDGDDTESWAGIESMARICERSESWVRRGLKELQAIGAITRQRRIGTSTLTTIHRLPAHLRTDEALTSARTESCASERLTRPSNNQTKENQKECSPSLTSIYLQEFDFFWDEYPRKVAKGAARKAYLAAVRTTPADVILAGLRSAAAHWRSEKTEKKYIPHPSTWLNGECWADDHGESTDSEDPRRAQIEKFRRTLLLHERDELIARREYPYDDDTARIMGEPTAGGTGGETNEVNDDDTEPRET